MNLPREATVALACGVVGLALAGALSCDKSSKANSLGPTIESADQLKPAAKPGDSAAIVLSAMRIPVKLNVKREGEYFTLELLAHQEVLETERYKVTKDAVYLLEAALEAYDPPLELVRFPFKIGSSWEWEGSMTSGGIGHRATAKITSSQDRLNVEGYDDLALKIRVDLKIEGGGPKPAQRTLAFWFVPGKGLLKREFGQASTRVPAPPEHEGAQ